MVELLSVLNGKDIGSVSSRAEYVTSKIYPFADITKGIAV